MRPLRLFLVAAAVVVIVVAVATVRFVVFPRADAVGKADVIVVIDAQHDSHKFEVALKLLAVNPRSTVLYSNGDGMCQRLHRPLSHLVCFIPKPDTTRGEARYAANYATSHHDTSMAVVVRRAQLSRARIRFSRCWHHQLAMVEEPMSIAASLEQVPYQAVATVKAETYQRGC